MESAGFITTRENLKKPGRKGGKTLSINNRDQDAPFNLAKIYKERVWSALEAGVRQ